MLFLGSWRNLLLSGLPMLGGLVTATGLGLLVFGKLDGLTLGFGAALIGVVIDYPTHLLCHLCFSPHRADRPLVLRRISPSLALGGLTTIASFGGLGLTSFPGFREIAFFSAAGVAVALAITLWVLPPLVVPVERTPLASRFVCEQFGRAVLGLAPRRRAMTALSLGVVALFTPLLPRLVWVDDMSKLWRMDPDVVREDRAVRERVSQFETGRLVIGIAPDREQAVALGEQVQARLEPLVAAGELGGIRSLHTFLWPESRQRENLAALRADRGLPARVRAAYQAAGFRGDAFAAFEQSLAQDPPPPLRFEDLADSPLADLVRPLLADFGRGDRREYLPPGREVDRERAPRDRGPAGRALLRSAPVPERRLRRVPEHHRAADLHRQPAGDRAAAGALPAAAPGAGGVLPVPAGHADPAGQLRRRSGSRPVCCTSWAS